MKNVLKVSMICVCMLCLVGSACRKEKNPYEGKIHAEGQVLEKGLIKKPIPNATVILYELTSEGAFQSVKFKVIDSTRTDANGKYVIERDAAGLSGSYHINARGDEAQFWNRYDEPLLGGNIIEGQKTVNTLFIQPYGFIKMHLKNISPVDNQDVIVIGGSWSGASETHQGQNVNYPIIRRCLANDTIEVGYLVRKTGLIDKYGKEKYFLNSHDTLKINILY